MLRFGWPPWLPARDCSNREADYTSMHSALKNNAVVLGVSGGIATYKSVELLRLLTRHEAQVRVMMTRNAGSFVGPLTFAALSGRAVCSDLFGGETAGQDASIRHIEWAQAADLVVIAPATANLIGKMANGIADDALSTFIMAVKAPIMTCPAMNTNMYQSAAVQRNLTQLRRDGHTILEPDEGDLACGTTGPGRLPDPQFILDRILAMMTPDDLRGLRFLVTAGPTQEPIDPVRYISNPSSGKMGYALAAAAEHRGAQVVLVSGPTVLATPVNVQTVKVQTSAQMAQAVKNHYRETDVVIKAAAVSDYRPEAVAEQKIKKHQPHQQLNLVQTEDILKTLGQSKGDRLLVGFAAETENIANNALEKLHAKNLDMIVANRIGPADSGFQAATNKVTLYFRNKTVEKLPVMPKMDVAHLLLDRIAALLSDR